MKTTKEERAVWLAQALEGEDGVEGVHDEMFVALIDDVDALEATLQETMYELENWHNQFNSGPPYVGWVARMEDSYQEARNNTNDVLTVQR